MNGGKMRKKKILFTTCWLSAVIGTVLLIMTTMDVQVKYFMDVEIHQNSIMSNCETDKCEKTDIVMVVGGHDTVFRTVTLIKSVLIHHQKPVHFHLIVDNSANITLQTLFLTWELPAVSFTVYSISSYLNRVDWIPNKHYSQNYGLIKLILPDILPASIEKVLLLDTDVLIVDDLNELLEHFERMSDDNIYAMVENMSKWYTTQDPIAHVWPAIGRGFNSGVALIKLSEMRSLNWNALWRKEAQEQLLIYGNTMLADQDVLNSVFKSNPQLIYQLPCEFNLQTGLNSQPELCEMKNGAKIVHFNSPNKDTHRNEYAIFFHNKYREVMSMDGNLFKLTRKPCETAESQESAQRPPIKLPTTDECSEFSGSRSIVFRTHLYARRFSYKPQTNDVTLITQLSMDRYSLLEQMMVTWKGPVSVAFYVTDFEAVELMSWMKESRQIGFRDNIAVHLVYKNQGSYPINYLRNVALNASTTDFVFFLDVDFQPSFETEKLLTSAVSTMNMEKRALIVPAFEIRTGSHYLDTYDKNDLMIGWNEKRTIGIFRGQTWYKGHGPTDYEAWKNATEPYNISWKKDYEPYVVVHRSVPRFDERFAGFGWNKVSHIMELHYLKYDFMVLPDVFCVHRDHFISRDNHLYRYNTRYRNCQRELKGAFVRDLIEKYQSS